jgi:hypothetical protein
MRRPAAFGINLDPNTGLGGPPRTVDRAREALGEAIDVISSTGRPNSGHPPASPGTRLSAAGSHPAVRQAHGDAYAEEVTISAGVVLAGGRSSRMGTPKAALEWHGSTLLRRTAGILARVTDGPVVVVRAAEVPR